MGYADEIVVYGLAPVAVDPDVLAMARRPVAGDPASMRTRRSGIDSGNPDVGVSIPAVIAALPDPVRVLMGAGRNDLTARRWRGYGDMEPDLCGCGADGQKGKAGGGENLFLHVSFSLELLPFRTLPWGKKLRWQMEVIARGGLR
jgi:hypothetical protein